jgi:RecA-family ATPase
MLTALGLITGACSRCGLSPEETSGLFLLDLDAKENADGLGWWRAFVATHLNGIEPETWTAISGGGGRHLYFLWPATHTPPTFKRPEFGVDGRGQGGYAVIPPSIHPNGRPYDWVEGFEPWTLERPAFAPAELVEWVEASATAIAHGGERAPPATATYNAVGLQTDGREDKMTRAVWGAVVDLRRQSPVPPSEDEARAEFERIWTHYELTTKSRLEPRPGVTNAELLDLEEPQRGRAEMARKWAYAVRHWDSKVAEAAKVPKSDPPPADTTQSNNLAAEFPSRSRPMTFTGAPPERRWLVADWVAAGEVNSLYGGGATGKSLLALQLCCSAAIGARWLGLETAKCSSLFVSCEDDEDELHRRHDTIAHSVGCPIGSPFAESVRIWDRVGLDNLLAVDNGRGQLTAAPFLEALWAEVLEFRPDLLVLDTLADMFGGNEVNRVQVNGFLKTYLGGLIRQLKAGGHRLTVLLLAHPSVAGEQSGTGLSGSTGWENGVRSRLYLSKDANGSPDIRTLRRAKANYAGGDDDTLTLVWGEGVFAAIDPAAEFMVRQAMRVIRDEVAQQWNLDRPYTDRRGHPLYLQSALVAKLLAARNPYSRDVLAQAIERLIVDREIIKSPNNNKRGWKLPKGSGDAY